MTTTTIYTCVIFIWTYHHYNTDNVQSKSFYVRYFHHVLHLINKFQGLNKQHVNWWNALCGGFNYTKLTGSVTMKTAVKKQNSVFRVHNERTVATRTRRINSVRLYCVLKRMQIPETIKYKSFISLSQTGVYFVACHQSNVFICSLYPLNYHCNYSIHESGASTRQDSYFWKRFSSIYIFFEPSF